MPLNVKGMHDTNDMRTNSVSPNDIEIGKNRNRRVTECGEDILRSCWKQDISLHYIRNGVGDGHRVQKHYVTWGQYYVSTLVLNAAKYIQLIFNFIRQTGRKYKNYNKKINTG